MSDSKPPRSLEKQVGRSKNSKTKLSNERQNSNGGRHRRKHKANRDKSHEKQRNRSSSNYGSSEEGLNSKQQQSAPVVQQSQVQAQPPVMKSSTQQQQQQPPPNKQAGNTFDIDPKTQAVFDRKKYRILEKLKQGSFGQVFKGEYVVDHSLVAIKVMDLQKSSQMFRTKYIPRELKAMIECRHQNIVQIYDVIRCNNNLFIFMEFCSNGDMASYVKKNGACAENLARIWFRQLVDALIHVHRELRMAHRDIKLDNILLDEKYNTKLTDFGFAKDCWNESKHRVEMAQTICGTEPYMSPQLIQRLTYNPYMADVWAMGVVLYCLLNGRFPYTWSDTNAMMIEQLHYPKFILSIFTNKTSEDGIDLTVRMLNPDERRRITLHEALEHPFLKRTVKASPRSLIWRSSKKTL